MNKNRKRTKALLWVAVCLYGAFFVGNYWAGHRGLGVGEPVVAQATDIACKRNWLVLGLRWSCTATIVKPDGTRYPYRNSSSMFTPADVGKSVPMVELGWRRSSSTLTTARDDFDSKPWDGGAMMVFFVTGAVGFLVLWPFKRKTVSPTPK